MKLNTKKSIKKSKLCKLGNILQYTTTSKTNTNNTNEIMYSFPVLMKNETNYI